MAKANHSLYRPCKSHHAIIIFLSYTSTYFSKICNDWKPVVGSAWTDKLILENKHRYCHYGLDVWREKVVNLGQWVRMSWGIFWCCRRRGWLGVEVHNCFHGVLRGILLHTEKTVNTRKFVLKLGCSSYIYELLVTAPAHINKISKLPSGLS